MNLNNTTTTRPTTRTTNPQTTKKPLSEVSMKNLVILTGGGRAMGRAIDPEEKFKDVKDAV